MARPEAGIKGHDQESKPVQIITTFGQFEAAVNEILGNCPDSGCGVIRCCPGELPFTQAVIEVGLVHTPMRVSSSAFPLPQDAADLRVGVESFLTNSFKKLNAQMEAVPHARELAAQPGRQNFY